MYKLSLEWKEQFLLSHDLPDIVKAMLDFNNESLNTASIHNLVKYIKKSSTLWITVYAKLICISYDPGIFNYLQILTYLIH